MSDADVPQASSEDPVPATPPPGPAPGPEDLLGLRIAAALIDLFLLAGVLAILAAAVGQANVSGGNFSVYLTGTWAVAFLALALGYYFVLEAWAGQTVGKRLLGLRVLSAEGARPSVWAVAGRTLLRIVDWLPFLYVAGFITMLATGTRRQRIGDLAARTAVARAVPVRHRGLALVPLAVVLLAAAGLLVYRATLAGNTLTTGRMASRSTTRQAGRTRPALRRARQALCRRCGPSWWAPARRMTGSWFRPSG